MPDSANSPLRRLGTAALTLLLLLLPALVAFIKIAEEPRAGELQRVVQGLRTNAGPKPHSRTARLYYGAALPAHPETEDPATLLPQARFANVAAMFAIASLLYLMLTLARRRTTALLACVALACLPPVFVDGAVLRPEVPAAVFGGLAMLLVLGFPVFLHSLKNARWSARVMAILAVGATIGLAASCLPAAGVYLLVPGAGLVMMMGALAIEAPRILRRRHWELFPLAGIQRRYLPWLLLMLGSIAGAWLLLSAGVDGDSLDLPRTHASVGLLPENTAAAAALFVLAALGTFRLLLGVGLRIERLRRVTPEALLLAYATALVAQWSLGDRRHDALMAAPALAVLVAEGAAMVLLWVRGHFVVRGSADQRATNIA